MFCKSIKMKELKLESKSVKKDIRDRIKDPFDAFNEFIWNSIDAKAKNIHIIAEVQTEVLKRLEVIDDGIGIDKTKLDNELFGVYRESQKDNEEEKHYSLPYGNKGNGRFSFILFSNKVLWETRYKDEKQINKKYSISIEGNSLNKYNSEVTEEVETQEKTGTKTIFTVMNDKGNGYLLNKKSQSDILDKLKENIVLKFCWVVRLLDLNIYLNNKLIRFKDNIEEEKEEVKKIEGQEFNFKFIKWKRSLKNQSSRIYYLDSNNEEKFVKTTLLNNKGDEFYHSLYIGSDFFDTFDFRIEKFGTNETYKKLEVTILSFLKAKRKPFIKKFSKSKIKYLKEKKLFPEFKKNDIFEREKSKYYEEAVKEVIEYCPKLVSNTNEEQKKVLLQLINKLLDDESSRKNLYDILEVLVDEENKEELEDLKNILKNYKLKNIIGTIRLIEDRFKTIESLKDLIYDDKNYYLESDLQKIIEEHFWIFGEEYSIIGAENDKFGKLLEVYHKRILKENLSQEKLIETKKEVDLMISRNDKIFGGEIQNTIIEIKKTQ